jgi:hypothetical protein
VTCGVQDGATAARLAFQSWLRATARQNLVETFGSGERSDGFAPRAWADRASVVTLVAMRRCSCGGQPTLGFRMALQVLGEFSEGHLQRVGDALRGRDARCVPSALDLTEVLRVHAGDPV